MREVKFKFLFKNKENDIISRIYHLDDLISMDLESIYENLEDDCTSSSCNTESQNFCDCGCMYEDYVIFKKLQYTGLKDKKRTNEYPKGQEIYEGDLIKCGDFIGEVYYEPNGCKYMWEHLSSKTYFDATFHDAGYRSEIIGNIYQDNKLLK